MVRERHAKNADALQSRKINTDKTVGIIVKSTTLGACSHNHTLAVEL